MSKTIWFINDYAGSAYHGMEFRNYYFAKELVKLGYSVYIITASYMHLFKKLPEVKGNYTFEEIDGINYVWVKVPHYSNSTDKKRVLKWFTFSAKLFFLPFKKMQEPDVVIASPMAPFLAVPAYRIAKKYNAKFFYEVKDIWPLSIVELGNISETNPLIKLMSWCENFALRKSDRVVSSLQNYGEHMKEIGIDKTFVWINNSISLDEMQSIKPLTQETKTKLPKNKFIIGYTGTVGIANGLEYFCKSAKLLQGNEEIAFVIVGDGKLKPKLLETYGNLENLTFIDPIPKAQVQSMLKEFDTCFIGWKKEQIYKYGISPNKLFDYMHSAKPILHAFEYNNIVKLYNCGITVEPENEKAIADGVLELFNLNKDERNNLGKNGKKAVIEQFSYEKLAKKYAQTLEEI